MWGVGQFISNCLLLLIVIVFEAVCLIWNGIYILFFKSLFVWLYTVYFYDFYCAVANSTYCFSCKAGSGFDDAGYCRSRGFQGKYIAMSNKKQGCIWPEPSTPPEILGYSEYLVLGERYNVKVFNSDYDMKLWNLPCLFPLPQDCGSGCANCDGNTATCLACDAGFYFDLHGSCECMTLFLFLSDPLFLFLSDPHFYFSLTLYFYFSLILYFYFSLTLFLFVSLWPSISNSLSPSISISLLPFISISLWPSISISLLPSISISLWPYFYLSLSDPLFFFFFFSLLPSISICLSLTLNFYFSLTWHFYLSLADPLFLFLWHTSLHGRLCQHQQYACDSL